MTDVAPVPAVPTPRKLSPSVPPPGLDLLALYDQARSVPRLVAEIRRLVAAGEVSADYARVSRPTVTRWLVDAGRRPADRRPRGSRPDVLLRLPPETAAAVTRLREERGPAAVSSAVAIGVAAVLDSGFLRPVVGAGDSSSKGPGGTSAARSSGASSPTGRKPIVVLRLILPRGTGVDGEGGEDVALRVGMVWGSASELHDLAAEATRWSRKPGKVSVEVEAVVDGGDGNGKVFDPRDGVRLADRLDRLLRKARGKAPKAKGGAS